MLGWHVLIGIGEAVITALTVSAVVAVRPDLVYAAHGVRPTLKLKDADGTLVDAPEAREAVGATRGSHGVVVGGGLAAIVLAGVVSFYASARPDGLEYVAGENGFLETARDHVFGDFALAGYGEVGGIPVGVAGVLGVVLTVGVGWLVFRTVSRGSRRAGARAQSR
jgi:cobalt/nickel transport system permease protein